MADLQLSESINQSTPLRATAHSRSRATSSSSVQTSSSLHPSPLKVAIVSTTSQPELSQDYASALIKHTVGEAIPELQRTLSDLDIESKEDDSSRSSSFCERTPRPDQYKNGLDRPSMPDGFHPPSLAGTPGRNPIGSRRSTISASATTTSLNLESADSVTVSSSAEAASGVLSRSAGSRNPELVNRSRKRYIDVAAELDGSQESLRRPEKGGKAAAASEQTLGDWSPDSHQRTMEHELHGEPVPQSEECKLSFVRRCAYRKG